MHSVIDLRRYAVIDHLFDWKVNRYVPLLMNLKGLRMMILLDIYIVHHRQSIDQEKSQLIIEI